jgi:hypothetical protein
VILVTILLLTVRKVLAIKRAYFVSVSKIPKHPEQKLNNSLNINTLENNKKDGLGDSSGYFGLFVASLLREFSRETKKL